MIDEETLERLALERCREICRPLHEMAAQGALTRDILAGARELGEHVVRERAASIKATISEALAPADLVQLVSRSVAADVFARGLRR